MPQNNPRLPHCLACRPGQEPVPIYHFTHVANLPGIMGSNALLSDNACAAHGIAYQRIGYPHIKDRRREYLIRVPPHGCIGDYVPFYVAPRSPMLYVISRGGVPGYAGNQDDIVYLVSSVQAIVAAKLPMVFTNGQANHAHTTHFDSMNAMRSQIDWPLMAARHWADTDADPQRKRRRQAEVLVYSRLPWQLVEGIAVRKAEVARRVRDVVQNPNRAPHVVIKPGWYY